MDKIEKYEFQIKIDGLIANIASQLMRVDEKNIDVIMTEILKMIGEELSADRIYIYQLNQTNTIKANTFEWCKLNVLSQKNNLKRLFSNDFPWLVNKITKNDIVYIENTQDMPKEALKEKKFLLDKKIQSLIILPIIVKSKSVGFVGMDNVITTDIWNDNDRSLLKIISRIFSVFFGEYECKKKLIEENYRLNKSYEELKKMQSEIIQKEKMSVIGQLSSGLAHEMSNTFATLKSNIELLDEYYDSTITNILLEYNENNNSKNKDIEFLIDEIGPIFNDIHHDFNKVKTVINSIRRLTDPSNADKDECNINDLIKEVLWIYRSNTYDDLELLIDLNEVSTVYCIRSEIEDVINSILKNSMEAFKKNNIKEPRLEVKSYDDEGYVVIEIIDNAGGIKKNIFNKVFEPFFTTKSFGEAYGLGLSQAYDIIVDRHNGKISHQNINSSRLSTIIKLPNTITYEKTK